jgi:glycerophosphoryl diester phosphodiesterase
VNDPKTPLIVQSFDDVILKHMAKDLAAVPRVYLVGAENLPRIDSAAKVKDLAGWATGLGPNKMIVTKAPDVVRWAHDAKLTVTLWTFRSSNTGTSASVRGEMTHFLYTLGVDAVFTDNPDQFPRQP